LQSEPTDCDKAPGRLDPGTLGRGTHALAPLSFRAASCSGALTLPPMLTGEGRASRAISMNFDCRHDFNQRSRDFNQYNLAENDVPCTPHQPTPRARYRFSP